MQLDILGSEPDLKPSEKLFLLIRLEPAGGLGIDECNIWGDYFYMEALMRFLNPDWKKYW